MFGFPWSMHWTIPTGIALAVAAYGFAIGPLRRRLELGPPVPFEKVFAFLSGHAILFLATTGPMHDLSDSYLLSVHMLQHVLIGLVAPPLWLVGTPAWLVRFLLRPPALRRLALTLGSAPVAFLFFNGMLALWHLPPIYNSGLLRVEIHASQHLLFIATSLAVWWPVLAPAHEFRGSMVVQFVYLLVVTFPMKAIAILLLFADQVIYPVYAIAPRIWGIDPMVDQGIAGLIMLIPAGMIFFVALGVHFFRWYDEARQQEQGRIKVVPLTRERAT
jgi:putative membrane protein